MIYVLLMIYMYKYIYNVLWLVGFKSFPRAAHLSLIHSLSRQPFPSPDLPLPSWGHPPCSLPLHRSPPAQGKTGARRRRQDEPDITGATPSLQVCAIHRGAVAYSVLL